MRYLLTKTYNFNVKFPKEDEDALITLGKCFTKICYRHKEWSSLHNWSYNKTQVHKDIYGLVRSEFPNVPSGIVQTARDVMFEAIKRREHEKNKIKRYDKYLIENGLKGAYEQEFPKLPYFKTIGTIRYDARTCSLKKTSKGDFLTFSSLEGFKRIKIQLHIPEFFREIYDNWKFKGVQLVWNNKKKHHIVNIIFQSYVEKTNEFGKEVAGTDLGIYNPITTTRDGKKILACRKLVKQAKAIRRRYNYNRIKLQAKGTRSAKRKLKEISGKEKRFSNNVNHIISKKIANLPVSMFAFEELKNIRKLYSKTPKFDIRAYHKKYPNRIMEDLSEKIEKNKRARFFHRLANQWCFGQLQTFVEYKANNLGKGFSKIDPRYTSKSCYICGSIGNRKGSRFKCTKCGHTDHADKNAAKNIRKKYIETHKDDFEGYTFATLPLPQKKGQAVVNQPNGHSEMKSNVADKNKRRFKKHQLFL